MSNMRCIQRALRSDFGCTSPKRREERGGRVEEREEERRGEERLQEDVSWKEGREGLRREEYVAECNRDLGPLIPDNMRIS
jgi:hypothetical protein